jgi:hypothetical protein
MYSISYTTPDTSATRHKSATLAPLADGICISTLLRPSHGGCQSGADKYATLRHRGRLRPSPLPGTSLRPFRGAGKELGGAEKKAPEHRLRSWLRPYRSRAPLTEAAECESRCRSRHAHPWAPS